MAYTDFTLNDLEQKFGIVNRRKRLFEQFVSIEPSERLSEILRELDDLPIKSEKAKSEWIVAPILRELRNNNDKFFTIHSGDNLTADESAGLKGECDFILSKDIGTFDINYPIIQVVEAKKNDIDLGVAQCAAQLLGAKIYNEKKGVVHEQIYGCVTTGNDWLFMVLQDKLYIDTKRYYLTEINQILAVFQIIIDCYKNHTE
jgi:hypothetical protein